MFPRGPELRLDAVFFQRGLGEVQECPKRELLRYARRPIPLILP